MIKVVVLILTVTDTSTGIKLYEQTMEWNRFSITGNQIEDCRIYGVREAHALTKKYKTKYPWASSNVNCFWGERIGAPA